MAIYYKDAGAWELVDKPYIKIGGTWRAAKGVFTKVSTAWDQAYEYDIVASAPPEISLQIIDNRYIKVGARLPGPHDTDLKRIRILVSRTEDPPTQFGAGALLGSDDDYPNEIWSDWWYNGQNPGGAGPNKNHADSSNWDYKQYPLNPVDGTNLPGDKTYYFAGWTEDKNGNWSTGTHTKIYMPKEGVAAPKVIVKEATFLANFGGSAGFNGAGYAEGLLTAQQTPESNGFWFYGNQVTAAVGSQGNPTVKNAHVWVPRTNDTGVAQANVNVFWHDAPTPTDPDLTPIHDVDRHQITKIGTLDKGAGDWLPLPDNYASHFDNEIKGLGLAFGIQASDFIVVQDLSTTAKSGALHLVWEEAL